MGELTHKLKHADFETHPLKKQTPWPPTFTFIVVEGRVLTHGIETLRFRLLLRWFRSAASCFLLPSWYPRRQAPVWRPPLLGGHCRTLTTELLYPHPEKAMFCYCTVLSMSSLAVFSFDLVLGFIRSWFWSFDLLSGSGSWFRSRSWSCLDLGNAILMRSLSFFVCRKCVLFQKLGDDRFIGRTYWCRFSGCCCRPSWEGCFVVRFSCRLFCLFRFCLIYLCKYLFGWCKFPFFGSSNPVTQIRSLNLPIYHFNMMLLGR